MTTKTAQHRSLTALQERIQWDDDSPLTMDIETRTVDIHIAKLRRKLEPDPSSPRYLITIRGAGYRLMAN